jgi:hypothetical protein
MVFPTKVSVQVASSRWTHTLEGVQEIMTQMTDDSYFTSQDPSLGVRSQRDQYLYLSNVVVNVGDETTDSKPKPHFRSRIKSLLNGRFPIGVQMRGVGHAPKPDSSSPAVCLKLTSEQYDAIYGAL